jgi:hypothetical protein
MTSPTARAGAGWRQRRPIRPRQRGFGAQCHQNPACAERAALRGTVRHDVWPARWHRPARCGRVRWLGPPADRSRDVRLAAEPNEPGQGRQNDCSAGRSPAGGAVCRIVWQSLMPCVCRPATSRICLRGRGGRRTSTCGSRPIAVPSARPGPGVSGRWRRPACGVGASGIARPRSRWHKESVLRPGAVGHNRHRRWDVLG